MPASQKLGANVCRVPAYRADIVLTRKSTRIWKLLLCQATSCIELKQYHHSDVLLGASVKLLCLVQQAVHFWKLHATAAAVQNPPSLKNYVLRFLKLSAASHIQEWLADMRTTYCIS